MKYFDTSKLNASQIICGPDSDPGRSDLRFGMVKPQQITIWDLFVFDIRIFSRYFIFDVHNFKCWARYGRNVANR